MFLNNFERWSFSVIFIYIFNENAFCNIQPLFLIKYITQYFRSHDSRSSSEIHKEYAPSTYKTFYQIYN